MVQLLDPPAPTLPIVVPSFVGSAAKVATPSQFATATLPIVVLGTKHIMLKPSLVVEEEEDAAVVDEEDVAATALLSSASNVVDRIR